MKLVPSLPFWCSCNALENKTGLVVQGWCAYEACQEGIISGLSTAMDAMSQSIILLPVDRHRTNSLQQRGLTSTKGTKAEMIIRQS